MVTGGRGPSGTRRFPQDPTLPAQWLPINPRMHLPFQALVYLPERETLQRRQTPLC